MDTQDRHDKALDLLDFLHGFNGLTESRVEIISDLLNVDAFEICKKQGIVYWMEEV